MFHWICCNTYTLVAWKCAQEMNLNRDLVKKFEILSEEENPMSNRSIIGPVFILVIGLLMVSFGVAWLLGVNFGSMIGNWGSNFGDFMNAWGTSFGEFMENWGNSLDAFFTGLFTPSTAQMIGGVALLLVGVVILIFALNALRK